MAYAYLTSLPKIKSEAALHRIAMASDGMLHLQTTSLRPVEEAATLEVYRESSEGRTAAIEFRVPWELIAPPHMLIHQPITEPPYYEIVSPEVFRVGMLPGTNLRIVGNHLVTQPADQKVFDYVILGEADQVAGLLAPFDEERTDMIMHCERLETSKALFDFWREQQNTDQMMGRTFEPIKVAPQANSE